jgi:hydroxymethylpyrimidine/phosphomethylpyrimidine kinase
MTEQSKRGSPVVLTIAGFDPSGGAGIIADVRTIASFGCSPVAAITSLTFQNSKKVFGANHQTAESVRAQVMAVIEQREIAAVKIGMLPSVAVVREVARLIRENNLPPPVIDPVIESSSGHELMPANAVERFVNELMPLARVVTPNIPEAETISGLSIEDEASMRDAAAKIRELGARAVLIKGGHLMGERAGCPPIGSADSMPTLPAEAVDLLDDNGKVTVFRGEWIDEPNVRGTGCRLSSAIAACLAKGTNLEESVRAARQFVADAIRRAWSQNRER